MMGLSPYFAVFCPSRPQKFGNSRAILLLGFDVRGKDLKETQEQRLERIKRDWQPWKERLALEAGQRKKAEEFRRQSEPVEFNIGGINKNRIKKLLRRFWVAWEGMESDEIRLAALIALANKFEERASHRRLRKMRNKYNREKHNLLNLQDEKCATCDRKARVRHHIIPLSRGGTNSVLNLILICNRCHEEIHPWMKA